MRRVLLAALIVVGAVVVCRAVSGDPQPALQGAQSEPVRIEVESPLDPKQSRYLELARQYALILASDELEKEAAVLEAKLNEARAARKLHDIQEQFEGIQEQLERVVNEHAGTGAAKAAEEMLKATNTINSDRNNKLDE